MTNWLNWRRACCKMCKLHKQQDRIVWDDLKLAYDLESQEPFHNEELDCVGQSLFHQPAHCEIDWHFGIEWWMDSGHTHQWYNINIGENFPLQLVFRCFLHGYIPWRSWSPVKATRYPPNLMSRHVIWVFPVWIQLLKISRWWTSLFERIGEIFSFSKKYSFYSFGEELEWGLGKHSLISSSENKTLQIITVVAFVLLHLFSLLTLGAHAQRGLRYLVCPSVCVSVYLNSRSTGY